MLSWQPLIVIIEDPLLLSRVDFVAWHSESPVWKNKDHAVQDSFRDGKVVRSVIKP